MVLYTGGLFLIYLVGMLFIPVLKLPLSVVVIQFFVSVVALIGYRMVLIYLWNNLVRKPKPE